MICPKCTGNLFQDVLTHSLICEDCRSVIENIEQKMDETKSGHPDFYKILEEMSDLHSRKNHDYAGGNPLGNFMLSEEIGISAHKGCFIRMGDKWKRLTQFFKGNNLKVKDESVEDTLKDLAVYSILCLILYREYKKKEE